MNKEIIECPGCGTQIELTEILAKKIESSIREKYQEEISNLKKQAQIKEEQLNVQFKTNELKIIEKTKKETEESLKLELSDLKTQLAEKSRKIETVQQRELLLLQKERVLQEKEKTLELETEKKIADKEKEIRGVLEKDKKLIEEKSRKQAETAFSLELQDLKTQLEEKAKKLELSQQLELGLRKKQRELEEREKALELDALRKLDAEKNKIVEETVNQLEEKHRLKDIEKDKKLSDLSKQIDDLKKKAEQGSQQIQGEVLELDLENRLKGKFIHDDIDAIQKGVRGADVLQTVKLPTGHVCGKILWESKRTKSWSDAWIQKGKDDQLRTKADLVVIMSEVLPSGIQQFELVNGVWITNINLAINLAIAIRSGMMQLATERSLQAGKQGKMEIVYNYLTGPEFKNRIEAIVGSFVSMKTDLDAEKRAMEKIWTKREKQIERVIQNISGMRGDLEGVADKALPAIKMLELNPESEDPSMEGIKWEE